MLHDCVDIASLIIFLCWGCLTTPFYINTDYRFASGTRDAFSALFGRVGLVFAPGLFEFLNAAVPDNIDYFLGLPAPTTSRKVWAVYLLVLEKLGEPPRLYTGSRTSERGGAWTRISQHQQGQQCPKYVQKAKDDGFVITHIGILASCPSPAVTDIPLLRVIFIAIEAALSGALCAIIPSATGAEFSFPAGLFPWSPDQVPWVGLCSHNPLLEQLRGGDLELTPAQLIEAAKLRKENHRAWERAWNATPSGKARLRARNKKTEAATIAKAAAVKASKVHFCDTCQVSCSNPRELLLHLATGRHLAAVARGGKDVPLTCVLCGGDVVFKKPWQQKRHNTTEKHLANVRRLAALPPSPDQDLDDDDEEWYDFSLLRTDRTTLVGSTSRLVSQAC